MKEYIMKTVIAALILLVTMIPGCALRNKFRSWTERVDVHCGVDYIEEDGDRVELWSAHDIEENVFSPVVNEIVITNSSERNVSQYT